VSEQNVALHRRALEAFNQRDIEAFIEIADPAIEYHSVWAEIDGAHLGHDGLRRLRDEIEDSWGDERRVEVEAYFDLGDQTLALHVIRVRGQQSGVEVVGSSASLMRWRDGRCVYSKVYLDREDALRELGVSEQTLKPIAPDLGADQLPLLARCDSEPLAP
jgi:ketosteroid isomerase-like protein